MVIVTRNQYILANKIHSITLDEDIEYHNLKDKNGRHKSVPVVNYRINVVYDSDSGNNQPTSRLDTRECSVKLINRKDAHKVYRSLIKQIREQMPDQLFLDQALEDILKQDPLENMDLLEEEELQKQKEMIDDTGAKRVRRSRKKKTRNKRVLPKTK